MKVIHKDGGIKYWVQTTTGLRPPIGIHPTTVLDNGTHAWYAVVHGRIGFYLHRPDGRARVTPRGETTWARNGMAFWMSSFDPTRAAGFVPTPWRASR